MPDASVCSLLLSLLLRRLEGQCTGCAASGSGLCHVKHVVPVRKVLHQELRKQERQADQEVGVNSKGGVSELHYLCCLMVLEAKFENFDLSRCSMSKVKQFKGTVLHISSRVHGTNFIISKELHII